MRKKSGLKKYIAATVAGLGLSALPLLLTQWASYDAERGSVPLAYFEGISFWVGLVIGYAAFFMLRRRVKRELAGRPAPACMRARPGFFRVAANKWGAAADIALAIAIVMNALTLSGAVFLGEFTQYAFTVLLLLSAQLHGIFNGRYFCYVMTQRQRRGEAGR